VAREKSGGVRFLFFLVAQALHASERAASCAAVAEWRSDLGHWSQIVRAALSRGRRQATVRCATFAVGLRVAIAIVAAASGGIRTWRPAARVAK
jgi:hypothetical protein